MQGNSFVLCPGCGVEHLISDLEAIAAERTPAYALCPRCQGFCFECGIELDEDWDIFEGRFFGVCWNCEKAAEEQHISRFDPDSEQGLLFSDSET